MGVVYVSSYIPFGNFTLTKRPALKCEWDLKVGREEELHNYIPGWLIMYRSPLVSFAWHGHQLQNAA